MIATVPCSMVVELKALEALRPPRGARSIPPRLPREEYRGPVYPVPSLLATRKAIYTTNSIESLNYQLRMIINNRGHVPFDAAAVKHIEKQATQNWQATLGERGGRLFGVISTLGAYPLGVRDVLESLAGRVDHCLTQCAIQTATNDGADAERQDLSDRHEALTGTKLGQDATAQNLVKH